MRGARMADRENAAAAAARNLLDHERKRRRGEPMPLSPSAAEAEWERMDPSFLAADGDC